jgi:hypothetical protein
VPLGAGVPDDLGSHTFGREDLEQHGVSHAPVDDVGLGNAPVSASMQHSTLGIMPALMTPL